MTTSIYKFFFPKCCLCSVTSNVHERYLLQLVCGHTYCNCCINDLPSDADKYQCVYDKEEFSPSAYPADLMQSVETLASEQRGLENIPAEELKRNIEYLQSRVKFQGVLCGDPNCSKKIADFDCPWEHGVNILSSTQCPRATECWRIVMCPFSHPNAHVQEAIPDQTNKKLTIKSKCMLWSLIKDENALIKSVLQKVYTEVPKFLTHCYKVGFKTSVKWVYLANTNEIREFQSFQSQLLEQAVTDGDAICTLPDDSKVYFSHMIRVSSPVEFSPVARSEVLESTEDAGAIEVSCTSQQYNELVGYLSLLEIDRPLPKDVQASVLIKQCTDQGVAVKFEKIIGTEAAINIAIQALQTSSVSLFREILSVELPESAVQEFVTAEASVRNVLLINQVAYGAVQDVYDLLNLVEDFKYSAECPPNVDELSLALACSEFKVQKVGNQLIGKKDAVDSAVFRLNVVEKEVPGSLDETELVQVAEIFQVEIHDNMITGNKEQVEQALGYIQTLEVSSNFPTDLPFAVIQSIAVTHDCRIDGVQLFGSRSNVERAIEDMKQHQQKVAPQPGNPGFMYHSPAPWFSDQSGDIDFDVLTPASLEFKAVDKLFHKSMKSSAKIIKVDKIYNKRLYTIFAYKHESLSQVEGRVLEIMQLFHGTSQTDPSVIYTSDEGLDSRLGKGMWGNGTYYAQKAAYSHQYSFLTPEGYHQMFLCHVLVGDYVTLPPSSLVKPPQKLNSSSCYTSVKGNTGGSDIWVTYEAAMSYPTYLITYNG